MGSIGGMIIPCGAEGIANPHLHLDRWIPKQRKKQLNLIV